MSGNRLKFLPICVKLLKLTSLQFHTCLAYDWVLIHRPAKEDGLSALAACCSGYGLEAMRPHLKRVWEALSSETMAPAEPGVASRGEDMEVRQELARSAADCLLRCLRSFGGSGAASEGGVTLVSLVLADAEVAGKLRRALTGASGSGSGSAARLREDRVVLCASATLAAVSSL